MKKFLKIFAISIALIFATLLVLPFIFQDKLTQIAKEEINNQINAKADFSKLSLSFISSFPKAKISLYDLSVIGIDSFKGDTLAYIENLGVKVGIMDVFKQPIEINSILLENVVVSAVVAENGSANWDIAKETGNVDTTEEIESDESPLGLRLKDFKIENAKILYSDKQGKMSSFISGLDFSMTGDLSAQRTILYTQTNIDALTYTMEGVKYLNKSKLELKAEIDADLVNSKYTFNDNLLRLNALEMGFDGWIAMPNEDINMDLSFEAKRLQTYPLLSSCYLYE